MNYVAIIVLVVLGIYYFFKGIGSFFGWIVGGVETTLRSSNEERAQRKKFLTQLDNWSQKVATQSLQVDEKIARLETHQPARKIDLPLVVGNDHVKQLINVLSKQKNVEELLAKYGVKVLKNIWTQSIIAGSILKNKDLDVITYVRDVLAKVVACKYAPPWSGIFSTFIFDLPRPVEPIKKPHKMLTPKPQYSQVKEDYMNWSGRFRTFTQRRVRLSDAELDGYFRNLLSEWESMKREIDGENRTIDVDNEAAIKKYRDELKGWEDSSQSFEKIKQKRIDNVILEKNRYSERDVDAIRDYVKLVLCAAPYPSAFPLDFDIDYSASNKSMILDYHLPSINDIPRIKGRRYLRTKDEYRNLYFKDSEINKLYDETLYKITLRTIYILFDSDQCDAIDLLTFNGWVEYIEKATGNNVTACIMSIQCRKKDFSSINLANVDAKACFQSLKGVSSSKLYGLAPIRPLLEINKQDQRFIASHGLDEALNNADNIAIMPWEEFEHLIRALFEKEFSKDGGEVKVTRASRDGGVDAIVFYPDEIRGGKIVIQAKRYINTVGLSAVRDLYGTVINEGAMKGILITTADYGPEAYEFAKDKPLTLLNGNNLLYMLHKHGYPAKIDLKDARQFFSDASKEKN